MFDWNEGRRADHPNFAVARRVWHELFQKRIFAQLRDLALPLKWLPGHDSVVSSAYTILLQFALDRRICATEEILFSKKSEGKTQSPVNIGHIQWLDMHD